MIHFDPIDRNFRRAWLLFSLVFFFLWPFLASYLLGWSTFSKQPLLFNRAADPNALVLISICLEIIFSKLCSFFLIFYCGYKKPGTALLAFNTNLMPLIVIMNFFQRLLGLGFPEYFELITEPVLLVNTLLYFCWAYLCFKLRMINKKIQVLNAPEYVQLLEALDKESNTESLTETYSALIRAWPQFEPVTSSAYKLRKTTLA